MERQSSYIEACSVLTDSLLPQGRAGKQPMRLDSNPRKQDETRMQCGRRSCPATTRSSAACPSVPLAWHCRCIAGWQCPAVHADDMYLACAFASRQRFEGCLPEAMSARVTSGALHDSDSYDANNMLAPHKCTCRVLPRPMSSARMQPAPSVALRLDTHSNMNCHALPLVGPQPLGQHLVHAHRPAWAASLGLPQGQRVCVSLLVLGRLQGQAW